MDHPAGRATTKPYGNARLCATLPKVHVVFAGIHKLVLNMEDAIKITRLLPRNATGQLLTSYITWIRGTVPVDGEQKEQHIVLIDGGREALYESKACANVCPVYQTVGGHVFGSIYISAIGIILHLRNEVTKDFGMGFVTNVAFKAVMKNCGLFHSLIRTASKLQGPVTHKNRQDSGGRIIRHLPLHFMDRDFTEWRDLPSIAPTSFRDQFDAIPQHVTDPKYRVGFFVGCGADFVYPEVGVSLIKVLNSLNVEVVFPKTQNCCAIPALYSGDTETWIDLAKQSVQAFTEAEVDYILCIYPPVPWPLNGISLIDWPIIHSGQQRPWPFRVKLWMPQHF
ncbi:MAG: hypothetical protein GY799_15065 [Desulfobulbaceae bacterium]|nr:hypothetical protein [Desulfobulbaceae bacterium]